MPGASDRGGSGGAGPTITGGELRRMLALRARLRQAVVGQARATQRELLRVMEEERQRRQTSAVTAWTPPAMATDELLREVKWRLDVASVAELDAAAEVLERAARAAARRPDRDAPPARGTRPPGPGRR